MPTDRVNGYRSRLRGGFLYPQVTLGKACTFEARPRLWESVMSRFNGYAVLGSLAVLMFSCVSAPPHSDPIASTQKLIERVEAMPLANEAAADISAARGALLEAQTMAADDRSPKDIANATDLARGYAELAEKQITLARAKEVVENAEKEWQAEWLAVNVNPKR